MSMAHSPLLPQVKTILGRLGYAPVPGSDALFMKKNSLDQAFYRVSGRQVQKLGVVPAQKPISHMQFVTNHVRHLFP